MIKQRFWHTISQSLYPVCDILLNTHFHIWSFACPRNKLKLLCTILNYYTDVSHLGLILWWFYLLLAEGVLVREEVALIGDLEGNQTFTFLDGENNTTLWSGRIPRDGSTITVENFTRLSLTIICYIYAFAGIVFAIICLVFNFVFRKKK